MCLKLLAWWPALVPMLSAVVLGADGNRLTYLDEFSDPYYVGVDTPKLTTPQWIGEEDVTSKPFRRCAVGRSLRLISVTACESAFHRFATAHQQVARPRHTLRE